MFDFSYDKTTNHTNSNNKRWYYDRDTEAISKSITSYKLRWLFWVFIDYFKYNIPKTKVHVPRFSTQRSPGHKCAKEDCKRNLCLGLRERNYFPKWEGLREDYRYPKLDSQRIDTKTTSSEISSDEDVIHEEYSRNVKGPNAYYNNGKWSNNASIKKFQNNLANIKANDYSSYSMTESKTSLESPSPMKNAKKILHK